MPTLAKDVLNLLNEVGESLTLVKVTNSAYNTATSSSSETTSTYSIVCAIVNYKTRHVDGSKIQRGDRKAIIAAQGLSVSPSIGDKISGLGDVVRLVDVQTIRESGSNVAFICQVRE